MFLRFLATKTIADCKKRKTILTILFWPISSQTIEFGVCFAKWLCVYSRTRLYLWFGKVLCLRVILFCCCLGNMFSRIALFFQKQFLRFFESLALDIHKNILNIQYESVIKYKMCRGSIYWDIWRRWEFSKILKFKNINSWVYS